MGKKFWANLALCVVIGGIFTFAVTNISSALTPKGLFVTEPKPSAEIAALIPEVQLVNYRLSESPGRMVHADFVVRNSSDQDVKNLKVLCEFYGADGKFLDRKTWLLSGKIPAGETMQHNSVNKRFVNTRARGLQCSLVDFDIVKAPSFVLHRASGGHGGVEAEGGHGTAAAEGGHGAPAEH